MEESINYSQSTTGIESQGCSEKTCASCFENRGCMYEHPAMTKTYNVKDESKQS